MDAETFAAARQKRLTTADDEMRSIVKKALQNYPQDGWEEDIIEGASVLFLETFENEAPDAISTSALRKFQNDLEKTLAKTTSIGEDGTAADVQVERITKWVGTYTVNAATFHANAANGVPKSRWVTMRDENVRATHVAADKQVRRVGGTFDIGGFDLHYPGEPVGPPEVWINCRCMLQGVGKGKSMGANSTSFAIEEGQAEEVVEPAPEVEEDDEADIDELLEIPVHGVAAPLGIPTGDGRMFAVDGMNFRDLPLPLAWQKTASHGGEPGPTVIVGKLTELWIDEQNMVQYKAWLSPHIPETNELIQGIVDGIYRGVSVDVDDIKVAVTEEPEGELSMEDMLNPPPTVFSQARIAGLTIVPIPAFQEAYIALGECDCPEGDPVEPHPEAVEETDEEEMVAAGFAPGTKDGPGWITDPVPTARIRNYWVRGKGAAKIRWGVPGDFNRCRKQLAKYITNPDWLAGACANMHKEALGVWPGQENGGRKGHALDGAPMFALVASAGMQAPPRDWFENPQLDGPTPLHVTDDGRIYGHLATWGTCHIGVAGICTTPPNSTSNYSYFRTGAVRTADGSDVPVGHITMGTGHAKVGVGLSAIGAMAHYDHTGAVVADIAAGEDGWGIWVAGAVREDVGPKARKHLKAAALSGDWREIHGSLEMIAALAVNVPGFPIPRLELAASGQQQTALVASGIVQEVAVAEIGTITGLSAKDIAREIRSQEKREQRVEAARRYNADAAALAHAEHESRLAHALRHKVEA